VIADSREPRRPKQVFAMVVRIHTSAVRGMYLVDNGAGRRGGQSSEWRRIEC
jgi:hypothetical protein